MSKEENLKWANAAVAYVKLPRHYGGEAARPVWSFNSGELTEEVIDDTAYREHNGRYAASRSRVNELIKQEKMSIKLQIALQGDTLLEVGYGNCTEQSCLAIRYLKETCHAKCVDMMMGEYSAAFNDDVHIFALIGRPDDSDAKDMGTWGADAVVCDPWAPAGFRVYDADKLTVKMGTFLKKFTLGGSLARINAEGEWV